MDRIQRLSERVAKLEKQPKPVTVTSSMSTGKGLAIGLSYIGICCMVVAAIALGMPWWGAMLISFVAFAAASTLAG